MGVSVVGGGGGGGGGSGLVEPLFHTQFHFHVKLLTNSAALYFFFFFFFFFFFCAEVLRSSQPIKIMSKRSLYLNILFPGQA